MLPELVIGKNTFNEIGNGNPAHKIFDLPFKPKSIGFPTRIEIFAQNVVACENGKMLKGARSGQEGYLEVARVGAFGSLLGHSEVRKFLGDTDTDVRNKALHMIGLGMVPLVCIGEEYKDRYEGEIENGARAIDFITNQIKTIYENLNPEVVQGSVIAYEPQWAIGTGKSANAHQIEEAHRAIRKTFIEMYGEDIAKTIRILYGGSANLKNIEEIFAIPDVDGFLVGSAGADQDMFFQMGQSMLKQLDHLDKDGRLPILAGNLKVIRRDDKEDISADYEILRDLDRNKIQFIIAPPNTLIQEFAKKFVN